MNPGGKISSTSSKLNIDPPPKFFPFLIFINFNEKFFYFRIFKEIL